jgi:hypothetical protein
LPSADAFDLPTSPKRFSDGAQYRIEIPNVEGPDVLEAVLEEAEKRGVLIHCISQGSGIMFFAYLLGEPLPISQENIDRLYDRYQNVYGQ